MTTRTLLADFRTRVVRPTLQHLDPLIPYSEAAENLLTGTAAHESGLAALVQDGGGPALGFFQIEPATFQDVQENFLRFRSELAMRVADFLAPQPQPVEQLVSNLRYAAAIARVIYFRSPRALPAADDADGLAATWKAVYNTLTGKGTTAAWLYHYRALVADAEA